MTWDTLLSLFGGPVLGILTTLVIVQMWALKQAKKEGIKEFTEKKMKDDLDAAFLKIKALEGKMADQEKAQVSDDARFKALENDMHEVKTDVKTILAAVQGLEVTIASLPKSTTRRKVS